MLRTVLSFQSPVVVSGQRSRQHSWELFGFNTGVNETGFFINNPRDIRTLGYRYNEDNIMGAKIAPFANTPGGDVNGGRGMTRYNTNGTSSAADGDMDIIYSLIIADKQWGSGGRYNYRQLALEMLEGFWRTVVHTNYRTILLGDWAWRFNAGTNSHANGTRPSDFILSHLHAYKAFDTERNWQEVIDATLNVIAEVRDGLHSGGAPNNGLLPDFALKLPADPKWLPAPPNFLEGSNDGSYGWNSCRTPWRLGASYLLYGDMPMAGNLPSPSLYSYIIKPLNDFAKARVGDDKSSMRGLSMGFALNAEIANSSQNASASFAVPFMLTAAAVGDDQQWVDAFWEYSGTYKFDNNWYLDYYKLIAMIAASGNYWKAEIMGNE
jgi:hypothetical protein